MTMTWRPLTEKWNSFAEYLSQMTEQGLLVHGEDMQRIFPSELNIGEEEEADIEEFINDRIQELYGQIFPAQGANPGIISAYLLRSIVSAMMWEKERIGR
jgi:hypothetical protein